MFCLPTRQSATRQTRLSDKAVCVTKNPVHRSSQHSLDVFGPNNLFENGQISPIRRQNQWFSKQRTRWRRRLLNLPELRKVLERAHPEKLLKVSCHFSTGETCCAASRQAFLETRVERVPTGSRMKNTVNSAPPPLAHFDRCFFAACSLLVRS